MKEHDVAKMAFAAVVRAIEELAYDDETFYVSFPNSVTVNGNVYVFVKTTIESEM